MPGKLVSDITAFDVTYANVLAPVGFHKAMTAKDDCVSADITNGIEGAQVTNLWYAQKDDEEDPIVNIDIIYDEEETPYGFTKVNKALGGGFFVGHKEILKIFINLHDNEFNKLANMGYCINDDKLLFLMYEKYPSLFHVYCSGYSNLAHRINDG